MIRIGIQVDFAGSYGRGVLRGLMAYANLQADWEFVMPPMYSLSAAKLDLQEADGVITMIHAAKSIERYRKAKVPVVNTARTITARQLQQAGIPTASRA